MANSIDNGVKEEPKTQFTTREGTYRLMTHSDYSRPNRVGYSTAGHGNTPVRVSFVTVPDTSGNSERICFNHGRELYIYIYRGIKKAADLTKPVDKRVYKSTSPTCHDFNGSVCAADSIPLLVGFSLGQIQLIDPGRKELNKIFNDEQLIEKTKVTCVRWLPKSSNQFLVSHASGQMYLYSEELTCGPSAPTYQVFKQGDGFTVYTCKTRSSRNPMYRWSIGEGAISRFEFSPCGRYLAVVSQDGFLRVFNYDSMELAGVARSYFGALTCVAWSPDGRYVAAGGEDDLLTVWSFVEKRVVARGRGHRSWLADVAFDPYTTVVDSGGGSGGDGTNGYASDETAPLRRQSFSGGELVTYRMGSVGQDTQLCLWDLTEDILRQPHGKSRASVALSAAAGRGRQAALENHHHQGAGGPPPPAANNSASSLGSRLSALGFGGGGEHKRDKSEHHGGRRLGLLLGGHRGDKWAGRGGGAGGSGGGGGGGAAGSQDPLRLIGTPSCPRLGDCPMVEPHVSCRVSHERLTAITFRQDCLVTGCSDGYVCTWARPGKVPGSCQTASPASLPPPANANGSGTVV